MSMCSSLHFQSILNSHSKNTTMAFKYQHPMTYK